MEPAATEPAVAGGEIADRLGIGRPTVTTRPTRVAARRLDGQVHDPRPGAAPTIMDARIEQAVTTTLETTPRQRGAPALATVLRARIATNDTDPTPFTRATRADHILAAVERCCQRSRASRR